MVSRTDLKVFGFVLGLAVIASACNSAPESTITGPTAVSGSQDASGSGSGGSGSGGSGSGGSGSGGSASGGSGSGESGGGDRNELRVRCERRPNRSKASVDGNNLASGEYRARIRSGANTATSGAQRTIGDEVEFDFDSNRGEGGTSIAANFIQNGRLTGELLSSSGAVVASATVECRVR